MTDDELPEWDNHGSPVSEPTALDIATAAIAMTEMGDAAGVLPLEIHDAHLAGAAAVLDDMGCPHDMPIEEVRRRLNASEA